MYLIPRINDLLKQLDKQGKNTSVDYKSLKWTCEGSASVWVWRVPLPVLSEAWTEALIAWRGASIPQNMSKYTYNINQIDQNYTISCFMSTIFMVSHDNILLFIGIA